MRNSAVQLRPSSVATLTPMARRSAVSLRNLIAMVFPVATPLPAEVALIEPSWYVVLRTATDTPAPPQTGRGTSPRKYLWVRRTSRRAYNLHMSKMREHLGDINPVPAVAIFGSVVGIALLLSILVR
jgi:hypothetical protein